jgi:hypothetical protein
MGVRVDKSGHDHAAGCVQGWFVGIGNAQFFGFSYSDDLLVANQDGTVFDDAEFAETTSALRTAYEGKELGCRMDEHENILPADFADYTDC